MHFAILVSIPGESVSDAELSSGDLMHHLQFMDKWDHNTGNKNYMIFESCKEELLKDYNRRKSELNGMSFDEFCEDEGYCKKGNDWGEYFNPNGLFDYFQIGGRFSCNMVTSCDVPFFKMPDVPEGHNQYVTAARVKDIAWDKMNYQRYASLHRDFLALKNAFKTHTFPPDLYPVAPVIKSDGIYYANRLELGIHETESEFMYRKMCFPDIEYFVNCMSFIQNETDLHDNDYAPSEAKSWAKEVDHFIRSLDPNDVLVVLDAHE